MDPRVSEAKMTVSGAQFARIPSGGDVLRAAEYWPWLYITGKRVFDVIGSIVLLPALAFAALLLVFLNPALNPGKLFFVQVRMGRNCRPFKAWKFRSMSPANEINRGAFDPLDVDRITPLGRWLRRTRIDELPQIFNVLLGQMSLIGPRPDYYPHAQVYIETIPGYRERYDVLPGITGYAQVTVGYVEEAQGVQAKVAADLFYTQRSSLRFDFWIAWRTFLVVIGRQGS